MPIFGRLALKPPVFERTSRRAGDRRAPSPADAPAVTRRWSIGVQSPLIAGDGAANCDASDLYRCPVHGLWRIYVSGHIVALGGGPAL